MEHAAADPRHGEQAVDLGGAVELLVGKLAEVLVALLQVLGGRGGGVRLRGQVGPAGPGAGTAAAHLRQEGDAGRRQRPDPVLVVGPARPGLLPPARLPEEVGALDRRPVLHVQEGRVRPRRERGVLVGQDLGQGRGGDVGYLLGKDFDEAGTNVIAVAAPVPRQGGNGNVQRRGKGGITATALQLLLRRRRRLRMRCSSVYLHRRGFGGGRRHDAKRDRRATQGRLVQVSFCAGTASLLRATCTDCRRRYDTTCRMPRSMRR